MTTVEGFDLAPLGEGVEAAFMYDCETAMPAGPLSRLGVTGARIGGGVALAMANDPVSYWSKALGFGTGEPFTLAVLDEVIGFYRASGVRRAVVQLIPSVLPDGFAEAAAGRGLTPGSIWYKLAGRAEEIKDSATSLRIGPVPAGEADAWAGVVLDAFGMPRGDLAEMMASTVGREGWRPYAAWDGDRVVAGGNVYLDGEAAGLNAAATLPEFRGRGAQSALIGVRAAAAVEAGCTWLFAETGKPDEGEHNPSLDNMVRAGLTPIYERQNWIWTA